MTVVSSTLNLKLSVSVVLKWQLTLRYVLERNSLSESYFNTAPENEYELGKLAPWPAFGRPWVLVPPGSSWPGFSCLKPVVSYGHSICLIYSPSWKSFSSFSLTKIIMFFFWEQVCSTPLKFRMKPTPLNGITYSWCLGLVMLQIVQFKCILNQDDPRHPSYQGGRHRRGGKGERELNKA